MGIETEAKGILDKYEKQKALAISLIDDLETKKHAAKLFAEIDADIRDQKVDLMKKMPELIARAQNLLGKK